MASPTPDELVQEWARRRLVDLYTVEDSPLDPATLTDISVTVREHEEAQPISDWTWDPGSPAALVLTASLTKPYYGVEGWGKSRRLSVYPYEALREEIDIDLLPSILIEIAGLQGEQHG